MKPEYIIIHHSATKDSGTVSWSAIRRYHTAVLGWSAIGYHYGLEIVNNNPEIFVGRMMNEYGAHCRGARMNRRSLGICFVGDFDKEEPPDPIWTMGVRLVRSLMDIFDIGPELIQGHSDYSNKSCPGQRFDMAQFRMDIS